MEKYFTALEKAYVKVVSYWDSHIQLITKLGETLHLGVQAGRAITACHPPGGNNAMLGALTFPNTSAEAGVGSEQQRHLEHQSGRCSALLLDVGPQRKASAPAAADSGQGASHWRHTFLPLTAGTLSNSRMGGTVSWITQAAQKMGGGK